MRDPHPGCCYCGGPCTAETFAQTCLCQPHPKQYMVEQRQYGILDSEPDGLPAPTMVKRRICYVFANSREEALEEAKKNEHDSSFWDFWTPPTFVGGAPPKNLNQFHVR